MFAKVMGLAKPAGPATNRDLIAQMVNFIAPKSLSKTSTNKLMAHQFHHSEPIHDQLYSSEVYIRDSSGGRLAGSLIAAHDIWSSFGESGASYTSSTPNQLQNKILTRYHFDKAAQWAYQDPVARVRDLQLNAIQHAIMDSVLYHAFVFLGCGTGKSGIYILMALARYLYGVPQSKTVVIPLTMHF